MMLNDNTISKLNEMGLGIRVQTLTKQSPCTCRKGSGRCRVMQQKQKTTINYTL
ncbi:MAG: hypothetical protein ACOWWO_18230 [Peptococcaceae bacterium]